MSNIFISHYHLYYLHQALPNDHIARSFVVIMRDCKVSRAGSDPTCKILLTKQKVCEFHNKKTVTDILTFGIDPS